MAATTNASTATWGVTSITGSVTGITGVVTDVSISTELIETPDVQDEQGMAVQRNIIEKHYTIECSITAKNNETLPKCGDDITIDSQKYILNSIEKTESNNDWTTYRISGEAFSECDTITKTNEMSSIA